MRLGSALLVGLRRQYNIAPCGWERGAKRDHIRVGSGFGGITFGSLLLSVCLRFPMGKFPISQACQAENCTVVRAHFIDTHLALSRQRSRKSIVRTITIRRPPPPIFFGQLQFMNSAQQDLSGLFQVIPGGQQQCPSIVRTIPISSHLVQ